MTDQIFQLACEFRKITDELGGAKVMNQKHRNAYNDFLTMMKHGDNTRLIVIVRLREFIENYRNGTLGDEKQHTQTPLVSINPTP